MKSVKKKEIIVLAMHGAPPLDFPPQELMSYFALSFKAAHQPASSLSPEEKERLRWLEKKIRQWPRSMVNDPFYAGSEQLRQAIERLSRKEVVLGFNEFCAPSVEEALEEAIARRPKRIIVFTPMLTPGGEHAARDIPAAIEAVKAKHPEVEIVYVWPFEPEEIARFLLRAGRKRKLWEEKSINNKINA